MKRLLFVFAVLLFVVPGGSVASNDVIASYQDITTCFSNSTAYTKPSSGCYDEDQPLSAYELCLLWSPKDWSSMIANEPVPGKTYKCLPNGDLVLVYLAEGHPCDRLAAHPFDLDRMAKGVFTEKNTQAGRVYAVSALHACEQGAKQYPGEGRFIYQTARVLEYLDEDAKAFELLETAVELGYCHAYYAYWQSADDPKEALIRTAAESGCYAAQFVLAGMYMGGKSVQQDESLALIWLRSSAHQGFAPAQYQLAMNLRDGKGVAKDVVEAFSWFAKSAEQSHSSALFRVGSAYANGEGVPEDYMLSYKWWLKGAIQGDRGCEAGMGYLYTTGRGVDQDYKVGVDWLTKSASQGNNWAQNYLGEIYKEGRPSWKKDSEQVIKVDYELALKWFTRSAEDSGMDGQINLAIMYREGLGIASDYDEAIKWFRKAADQGSDAAQLTLGRIYENGDGVPRHYLDAVKWYRKAANNNNSEAQMRLGAMYEQGKGVERDFSEAYIWYSLALISAESAISASEKRDKVEKELSTKILNDTQNRVRKIYHRIREK